METLRDPGMMRGLRDPQANSVIERFLRSLPLRCDAYRSWFTSPRSAARPSGVRQQSRQLSSRQTAQVRAFDRLSTFDRGVLLTTLAALLH